MGFFEKTELECLHIDLVLVKETELQHKIKLDLMRKSSSLAVTKNFYLDELLTELRKDREKFFLIQAADMLLAICKKYDLDSAPVKRFLKANGSSSTKLASSGNNIELSEDNEEELYIYVKLAKGLSSEAKVMDTVAQLMDGMDEVLEENDLGRVDGSEYQLPYYGISCMGPDCRLMYKKLSRKLKALPVGSYVELRTADKTERIELGKKS